MKPILVTSYVSPDTDGTACLVAYAEYLNKTGLACESSIIGELHVEAKYVFDKFGISYPKQIQNDEAFDKVILVDSSDINALEGKINPTKVVEIIDHRKVHEADKFINAKSQIELVGAAATLVAEKFKQNNIPISKEAAVLIYAAIVSNTLNFKNSVTTERDKLIAAWLKEQIQIPEDFVKELFVAKSDLSGEKLNQRIEDDFSCFDFGGKKVGIAQLEVCDVKNLLQSRLNEINEALIKIKSQLKLDYVFQNTIDLDENKSYLVTNHLATQNLLNNILGVSFNNNVAALPKVMMRKQITPLLKDNLENLINNQHTLMPQNKGKIFLNTLFWGLILWLFGYVLGIVFFAFVPKDLIGWYILPLGVALTLWVLIKKIVREEFGCYVGLGIVWTVLAALLDYLLIVKLFQTSDYYKLDVYVYYILTFALPIIVGLYKFKRINK